MSKGHRSQIKKERNQNNRETRPRATAKFIRVPDKKARVVLDEIKGKDAKRAIAILTYSPRYAAYAALKVLKSAVANAENNLGMDTENLYVEEAVANQGPTLKRIRPRARGSADRILKRMSHITIILNEKRDKVGGN
jgi:large subunit ribosomal protein L22